MQVKTNNHDRPFLYGYEVPDHVIGEDYDHLDECDTCDHWIKYRGQYYHVSDFMRVGDGEKWMGYYAFGFYMGLVIQISNDCETYKIGTYTN